VQRLVPLVIRDCPQGANTSCHGSADVVVKVHAFQDITPCKLFDDYRNVGGTLRFKFLKMESVRCSETPVTPWRLLR
jgi:hypothetical protein